MAKVTLEDQLKGLAECGIKLREGLTIQHLLSLFDRAELEAEPYILLLTVLGGELDEKPTGYASNNIWHFDTECIEDRGDYARIARRMSELAGGGLPLQKIKDFVDIDDEKAWLSFELDGKPYKWNAQVEDDWVDEKIISELAKLLAGRNTGHKFTYLDLGGQDCLIGCATPDELKKLKKLTGLAFEWLK
ncbi:MAG: hypothetical protein AB1641_19870 [Thermodesulfobacteriota bacterium]